MTERSPRIEIAALVDRWLTAGASPDEIGKALVLLASRCFELAGGEARAAAVFRAAAEHFAEAEEAAADAQATRH